MFCCLLMADLMNVDLFQTEQKSEYTFHCFRAKKWVVYLPDINRVYNER